MPPAIGNRAADNWRPLLAVADAGGEDWAKRARQVAEAGIDDEDEIRVRLLRDIRAVFVDPVMHSQDLVRKLNALEDAPWSEFQKGKQLSQAKMAHMLHDFGIKPTQIKIAHLNRNGFHLHQFTAAFAAYLAPGGETGSTGSTALETQEKVASEPLPLAPLPDNEDLYPECGGRASVLPIRPLEGRTLEAQKVSKNNAVEAVEANPQTLERCVCAQCGADDGKSALHRGRQFGPSGKWLHRECVRFFLASAS
jgi:hypothetical protein